MISLSILLSLFLLEPSMADNNQCEDKTKANDIYACLNDYANSALASGSAADLVFQEKLSRLLAKYNLRMAQIRTKSMDESFNIILEKTSQVNGEDNSTLCFPFDSYSDRQKKKAIAELRQQIDEAALFLADIHSSSWGHQVSLLFPIKEVSICSRRLTRNRAVLFEQRSLVLGFKGKPLTAQEILQKWNSGNPIRSTELTWVNSIPFLGAKLRAYRQAKIQRNPEAVLRDKLADNWMVLNPTGSLRTTALYTMGEAIFNIREALNSDSENHNLSRMFFRLSDTAKGPGFTEQDRKKIESFRQNDRELAGLYSLWQQKLQSPQNIITVIENAIGDQARHDTKLHLVLRKIKAGVAVVNDKNIVVRLEQMMEDSIPVSKFEETSSQEGKVEVTRTETTQRANGEVSTSTTTFRIEGIDARDINVNADEMSGGVVVDLIDDVTVSVQLPKVSPAAYKRISLFQALQEYIPETETSRLPRH